MTRPGTKNGVGRYRGSARKGSAGFSGETKDVSSEVEGTFAEK